MSKKPKPQTAQKTFRAPQDLMDRLDRRAMEETIALGLDVSPSDIIRRALERDLLTPVGGRRRQDCLITATVTGWRCLNCKADFDKPQQKCPVTGEDIK